MKHFRNCLKRPYPLVLLALSLVMFKLTAVNSWTVVSIPGHQCYWFQCYFLHIAPIWSYLYFMREFFASRFLWSVTSFKSFYYKPLFLLDICLYYSFYGHNFMFTGTSWTRMNIKCSCVVLCQKSFRHFAVKYISACVVASHCQFLCN